MKVESAVICRSAFIRFSRATRDEEIKSARPWLGTNAWSVVPPRLGNLVFNHKSRR